MNLIVQGGKRVNNIAAWNGTSWSSLGNGIRVGPNQGIYSLTVFNGNLIVGGAFDSAGSNRVNNIAEWNGTSWSALGKGMNDVLNPPNVTVLTVYNSSLYAGGGFDSAGGKPAYNIAEWCPSSCPAGINEITTSSGEVQVFPNPNNGQFTIQSSVVSGKSSVEIYNMLGEKIYAQTLRQAQGDFTIDLSNNASGVYLYRVIDEAGDLISSGKFVIQK